MTFISPPFCQGCSLFLEKEEIFCTSCFKTIIPVAPLIIPITLKKRLTVHALGAYAPPLKKIILAKNHYGISASALLAHALWRHTLLASLSFDYIVAIPLHWTRTQWRGFNQAEEMGAVIARYSGKKMISLIKRHKKTKFQSACNKIQRAYNMHDAFSLKKTHVSLKGKTILVVDDLCTTGTTLMQITHLLYRAGAHHVVAVVASRAV